MLRLVFSGFLAATASAQVLFTTNDLPSQPGYYNCSYCSTNIDVTALLALSTNIDTNAPPPPEGNAPTLQAWKLSYPQQSYEFVLRVDIVAATNGGDNEYFPSATYAEQDTVEPTNVIGWQYYGFTNAGRLCYGLDARAPHASTQAVFIPPSVDIPATIQLGQTWNRSSYWFTTYAEIILVSNYFSDSAVVDAYGTVNLPQLGSVSAVRVHETHSYALSEIWGDSVVPIDLHTNEYYYWLVPGLGVAAQLLVLGDNVLSPGGLPYTNSFSRMYFANYFNNSPTQVVPMSTNLGLQILGSSILLNWQPFTNSTHYRVDYVESLPSTNWEPLGYTSGNSWTDLISSAQRFYRVVGSP